MDRRAITKPSAMVRVVHDAHLRKSRRNSEAGGRLEFREGETVRSLRLIENDGIYPRRDFGETLVQSGDAGIVRGSWCFLGEIYYTVEFAARTVFVIMHGREMARISADIETSIV